MHPLQPPSPQNPHDPDAEPDTDEEASERDQVIAMRYLALSLQGFPPEEARLLALDDNVDWHRAVEMLHAGCDPTMVVRILS